MLRTKNSKGHYKTLTEKAYEVIKRLILRGELAEETFVPEAEIIKKYGFGRTPLREACNRLHHEQLLEVVPHRGYLIPEMSFRAVRDLFEARHILERVIGELACSRATETQIKDLARLAKLRQFRNGGPDTMIENNKQFHLAIAAMTRNQQLVRQLRGILEQAERLMYIELRSSRFREVDPRMEHGPIVEAIRRRDPVAAKKAIAADINLGQAEVLAQTPVMSEET